MIGVDDQTQGLGSSPSMYKRDMLFYDQMLLMHSGVAIHEWRHGPYQKKKYHQFADEMEYLLETPYFLPAGKLAGVVVEGENVDDLQTALRDVQAKLREALPGGEGLKVSIEQFSYLQGLNATLTTRLAAQCLSNIGSPATSAHQMPAWARLPAKQEKLTTGDVVRLAINRVMIPDERTSWEDIFALKEDKALQDRARKLRLWAIKTAKGETSLANVEEQISDLLSDYEAFLKAHRIKYSYTTLESVVTGSASLIEDVGKLRLKALAGRLFTIQKTRADMTLAEQKAPGRELSVVTMLNEQLA